MIGHGGILMVIVRYFKATDDIADDFFNGLLKLGKSIDQAHVSDKRQ